MRLGILGGTFDPIHFGHLLAAEEVCVTLGLDRVLFAPAEIPPHKQNYPPIPIEHRLMMVRLAISDNPAFDISTVDIDRAGPHYTVDTVRLLRSEWGTDRDHSYFIMGADFLVHLGSRHEPERLIQTCRLAVVGRPSYPIDMKDLEADDMPGLSARLDWVDMPMIGIASSDLQRRVRQGLSIRYQMPAVVAGYIDQHNLYR